MGHRGGLNGNQCVSSNEDWVSLKFLLSLFLTGDFWTLRTDETNRYEPVLGHSNTEESGSDGKTFH